MMPLLLAFLLFSAVAMAGFATYAWSQEGADQRETLRGRLRKLNTGSESVTPSLLRDQRLSSIPALNTLLMRTPLVMPLVIMIRQAARQRVGR
jgi:hypothetical protein